MLNENDNADSVLQQINRLSTKEGSEAFAGQLTLFINHLLLHDFQKLIYLLYRIDINEQQLKKLLAAHPKADAAVLITNLIIARQLEKIKARSNFKPDDSIADEDRW